MKEEFEEEEEEEKLGPGKGNYPNNKKRTPKKASLYVHRRLFSKKTMDDILDEEELRRFSRQEKNK